MTPKQRILRFVGQLPDDVTYDRVIYHLHVMRDVETALGEAARGEGIEHEELFAQLLAEDAKNPNPVAAPSKAEPARSPKVHRARVATGRGNVRKPAQKRGGKTKKVS
jgi:hypothetical protein